VNLNLFRRLVQTLVSVGTNGYLLFPFTLDIYKGPLKAVCHPGLNCYACPGALLSCPVGAFQNFLGAIRLGVEYLLASAIAWASAMLVGFVVNRRFTFGIVGAPQRGRDFAFYIVGALLQLLLGLGDYGLLIGRLHFDPTPAFVLNLTVTTVFSFLFLRFVTFRRAAVA
jgi:putative flippase GtrA